MASVWKFQDSESKYKSFIELFELAIVPVGHHAREMPIFGKDKVENG